MEFTFTASVGQGVYWGKGTPSFDTPRGAPYSTAALTKSTHPPAAHTGALVLAAANGITAQAGTAAWWYVMAIGGIAGVIGMAAYGRRGDD